MFLVARLSSAWRVASRSRISSTILSLYSYSALLQKSLRVWRPSFPYTEVRSWFFNQEIYRTGKQPPSLRWSLWRPNTVKSIFLETESLMWLHILTLLCLISFLHVSLLYSLKLLLVVKKYCFWRQICIFLIKIHLIWTGHNFIKYSFFN